MFKTVQNYKMTITQNTYHLYERHYLNSLAKVIYLLRLIFSVIVQKEEKTDKFNVVFKLHVY